MMTAHFAPSAEEAIYGRVSEDVTIEGPAHVSDGLAFVVRGLESGNLFLAWADELCWVAEPAEVLR